MMELKDYKNILAIDSSMSELRVALKYADGRITSKSNKDRYRHAEFVFILIENLLAENDIARSDLNAVIVSTGPGSFTGLRVGMASAKGLAVSMNIPIVGISTFSAAARRLYAEVGKAAILIPSRRNEYYLGVMDSEDLDFRSISVISLPDCIDKIKDIPVLPIDFDASEFKDLRIIKPDQFDYHIADLIDAGFQKLKSSGGDNIDSLEPLYIQKFSAKIKK